MVGKLVVGEAKPSLLEVLHSKPVSPLSSLDHKSEVNGMKNTAESHVAQKVHSNISNIYISMAKCIPSVYITVLQQVIHFREITKITTHCKYSLCNHYHIPSTCS